MTRQPWQDNGRENVTEWLRLHFMGSKLMKNSLWKAKNNGLNSPEREEDEIYEFSLGFPIIVSAMKHHLLKQQPKNDFHFSSFISGCRTIEDNAAKGYGLRRFVGFDPWGIWIRTNPRSRPRLRRRQRRVRVNAIWIYRSWARINGFLINGQTKQSL